jgi:hypothetical protein
MIGEDWQRTHKRLLHTLGNLTLTGYNPTLSNKPFAAKREEFVESKLSCNAFFKETTSWDSAVICQRSRELAQLAVKAWPRPAGIQEYRPARGARAAAPKAGRERRRAYWTKLIELLHERQSPWLPLEPVEGAVLNIPLPVADASLSVRFQLQQQRLEVPLRFARKRGRKIFEHLASQRDEIDGHFEVKPLWGAKSDPTISVALDHVSIKDPLDWHGQHEWVADRLNEFRNGLFQRLAALDAQVAELSPARKLYLEYWTSLRQRMELVDSFVTPTKPLPQYWQTFSVGRSEVFLDTIASAQAKLIAVQLVLGGPAAKTRFRQLQKKQIEFEQAIGHPLDWQEAPKKKQSRVRLQLEADPTVHSDWPRQHGWLIEQLNRFHAAFSPAVKQLKAEA